MRKTNRGDPRAAANDDDLAADARAARLAASIDDPCAEAGFDGACRGSDGSLCGFHEDHCHAPDYACLDLLRHALALRFLEDMAGSCRDRQT
ncbi:MAG: hypothetical protein NVSMB23_20980 [Myxococcales bacterium]